MLYKMQAREKLQDVLFDLADYLQVTDAKKNTAFFIVLVVLICNLVYWIRL